MRLLFLGDMVGKTGRTAVWERLPGLISDLKLDFVIVNGENAAGGFGITEEIFPRDDRRRRRCGDHRQPCLGPEVRRLSFCAARASSFLQAREFSKAGTPGQAAPAFYIAK